MGGEGYDAIVVGAGPSGSSCAILLAKKGLRVLVIDKETFPRDKPCGDAIGGKALSVLSELGLSEKLFEIGFARSSGLVFSSPNGSKVEIQLPEGGGAEKGYVCRREALDAMLFCEAKKHCETLEGARVAEVLRDGGNVDVVPGARGGGSRDVNPIVAGGTGFGGSLSEGKVVGVRVRMPDGSGRDFFGKAVVGADGANSIVASKTGCARFEPKHMCSAIRAYYSGVGGLGGNIEVHFLPECMPGYFWIFPLSESTANVGTGMLLSDIGRRKANLSRVLAACMRNPRFAGRFGNAKQEGEERGWMLPLASARRKCAGDGFLLVGDAASLVDPFSGEGVGNGMVSAKLAAEAIGAALSKGGEMRHADFLGYEKALWGLIGPDVSSSLTLQKAGKLPFMLDLFIGKAQKSARLRSEIGAMISSKEEKMRANDPAFCLRMLFC